MFNEKKIKYKSIVAAKLSIEQYLKKIRTYLRDMIDDLRIINLTTKNNIMSTKDTRKTFDAFKK